MKKNSQRRVRGKEAASPFRTLAFIAVIIVVVALISGYIWRALTHAEHFRVKHIVVKQSVALDLDHLKGRNILTINLAEQSRYIAQFYPDLKSIKLSRVMPDRIYVDARPRTPVAAVKLYKNFAVDEDGLLFNFHDREEEERLPVITGLETKIFGPKAGKKYAIKELVLALEIITEASKARELKDCRIVKIDASSPANLSIVMDVSGLLQQAASASGAVARRPYMEVKFGGANIRGKVRLLENILVQERKELSGIKYIDLRFANPVIKFDDAKK